MDGLDEIVVCSHLTVFTPFFIGEIEVEQHHHPGFRVQPGQGDHPHPHRHRGVVSQEIEEPEGPDQGEGHREKDDGGLGQRAGVEVDDDEDDENGHGNDHDQPPAGLFHVFVLAAPDQGVAGGQMDLGGNGFLRRLDKAAHVDVLDVHIDPGGAAGVFALDGGRSLDQLDVRHLGDGDMGAVGQGDQDPAQGREVVAVVALVADIDGITLQPFHALADVHAADGALDHVLDGAHREPVTGGGGAVDGEIEIVAAYHPFGVGAQGAGHGADHRLDLFAQAVEGVEVIAHDLDAHRGLDPGGEHVDPGLDGHGPGVGEAGKGDGGVEFGCELVHGDGPLLRPGQGQDCFQRPGPLGPVAVKTLHRHPAPLVFRLEHDGGLQHGERRRIGGGLGAADLAEDPFDLGKAPDDAVGLLEEFLGLGDGDPGQGGGHVEEVALVERRHEFAAHVGGGPIDGGHQDQGGRQHCLAPPEGDIHHRMIETDEQTVDGIGVLGLDIAADEPAHEHRHQGDGEDRRRRHGVGLGEGQGLEEAAGLFLEGEDRQKGDRDHQQGVEEGGPDLHGRVGDDVPMPLFAPVALEMLVGVLDHDDGGVDHGADGDGDPAQAHDVGVDPLTVHDDKGHEDGDGQGDNGHQGAGQVEEKQGGDHRHHDALLDEFFPEGVHGAFDEPGAVIDRLDGDPRGQAALQGFELGADPLDGGQGVFTAAHDDDAAHRLALAVKLGRAPAEFGADADLGHVLQENGGAVAVGPYHHLPDIVKRGEIALAPDHEFALPELDDPAAHVVVSRLHRPFDGGNGEVVGQELVRIKADLVLLDIAADARHLAHPFHRGQFVAQIPVLDGTQLGEVVFAAGVLEGVFIDPADAGGVRPQARSDPGRELAGGVVEVFQDPGAGPVHIGAVLEDDIDERVTKKGIPPHHLGPGHGQHLGGERVGDLVFHHLRRLSRIGGEDDDLDIGEVRDGVNGSAAQRITTRHDEKGGHDDDHELVADGPGDDTFEHCGVLRGLVDRLG